MGNPDTFLIRRVSANLFFWQGLRWVGPGAALLLFAWGSSPRLPQVWREVIPWAAIAIGAAGATLAARYYAENFGHAQPEAQSHERRDRIKWTVVYPMMFLALIIDSVLALPVVVSGFVFAGGMEAYRRSTGGGREHYLLASLMFSAFGFAPVLDLVRPGRDAVTLFIGLLGLVYVGGGLLDHLALCRALRRTAEEIS